jgi:hypothetical protein
MAVSKPEVPRRRPPAHRNLVAALLRSQGAAPTAWMRPAAAAADSNGSSAAVTFSGAAQTAPLPPALLIAESRARRTGSISILVLRQGLAPESRNWRFAGPRPSPPVGPASVIPRYVAGPPRTTASVAKHTRRPRGPRPSLDRRIHANPQARRGASIGTKATAPEGTGVTTQVASHGPGRGRRRGGSALAQ